MKKTPTAKELSTVTDRGTKLSRAIESLNRTQEALDRNIGTITEQDWREALKRQNERVTELRKKNEA